MPWKAILDGAVINAFRCDDKTWQDARRANSRERIRLVAQCCGRAVFCKTSRRHRRFFAHTPQTGDSLKQCSASSESEHHLALKIAVTDALHGWEGWEADFEVPSEGREWQADVLAAHVDGRRVAIEIQLSPQGRDETADREARYHNSGVTVFWIVGKKNNTESFGSERRIPVDLNQPIEAISHLAKSAAQKVLARLQRQEQAIREIGVLLEGQNISFEYLEDGRALVGISLLNNSDKASRMILFTGAGLQSLDDLTPTADELPSDGPLVFEHAEERGYERLKPWTVKLPADRPKDTRIRIADSWAKGALMHNSIVNVPLSVVHYPDICPECRIRFQSCKWVVAGFGTFVVPEGVKSTAFPLVLNLTDLAKQLRKDLLSTVTNRTGQPAIYGAWDHGHPHCSKCGGRISDHVVNSTVARTWPCQHTDGFDALFSREHGWSEPSTITIPRPIAGKWEAAFNRKLNEIARTEREAEEQRLAKIREWEERRKKWQEEQQQRLEAVERKREEAAAEERHRLAAEIEIRRQQAESEEKERRRIMEYERAEREVQVRLLAEKIYPGDGGRQEAWLRGTRPEWQRRNPLTMAGESDGGLRRIRDWVNLLLKKGRPSPRR